eukprot:414402-Hanusia_phi.AAC.1
MVWHSVALRASGVMTTTFILHRLAGIVVSARGRDDMAVKTFQPSWAPVLPCLRPRAPSPGWARPRRELLR